MRYWSPDGLENMGGRQDQRLVGKGFDESGCRMSFAYALIEEAQVTCGTSYAPQEGSENSR